MSIVTSGAFPIDPYVDTGLVLTDKLNQFFASANSTNLYPTRPDYVEKGGLWAKDNGASPPTIMMFDGTTDVEVAGTGNVTGAASSVSDNFAMFSGTTGKLLKDSGNKLTSSNTDATAGRITKAGDFGLGGISSLGQILVNDFNSITATGFYYGNVTTSNTPIDGNTFSLIHHHFSSAQSSTQIATELASGRQFVRSRDNGGAWFGWAELINSINSQTISGAKTFTSDTKVTVNSTTPALKVTQTGTGYAFVVEDSASTDNSPFVITNNGTVGIGVLTPSVVSSLHINKSLTGATTAYSVINSFLVLSDVTLTAYGNLTQIGTTANAGVPYTITNIRYNSANQSAFHVDSTVATQVGYAAEDSLIGATTNYGFYGNIPSGTGRWNFYAAGSAPNYFAGNVILENALGLGTASAPNYGTAGQVLTSGGANQPAVWVDDSIIVNGGSGANRWIKFPDGTLIQYGRYSQNTGNNLGNLYTFPTAFFDTNYSVHVNAIGFSSGATSGSYVAEVGTLTLTTCLVKVLSHGSTTVSDTAINIMVQAIGRWKA